MQSIVVPETRKVRDWWNWSAYLVGLLYNDDDGCSMEDVEKSSIPPRFLDDCSDWLWLSCVFILLMICEWKRMDLRLLPAL